MLEDKPDKMQSCCAQFTHAAISVVGIRCHKSCTGLYRLGTQCRMNFPIDDSVVQEGTAIASCA